MRLIFAILFAVLVVTGAARAGETLTVYTYDSFVADWGPGPAIKKSFEAECDCTLNWVGIQDGVAILNRLKLEGSGSKADVVVFDPDAHWTVVPEQLISRGANTPFAGYELTGRAVCTIVGGEIRFERPAATSGSDSRSR